MFGLAYTQMSVCVCACVCARARADVPANHYWETHEIRIQPKRRLRVGLYRLCFGRQRCDVLYGLNSSGDGEAFNPYTSKNPLQVWDGKDGGMVTFWRVLPRAVPLTLALARQRWAAAGRLDATPGVNESKSHNSDASSGSALDRVSRHDFLRLSLAELAAAVPAYSRGAWCDASGVRLGAGGAQFWHAMTDDGVGVDLSDAAFQSRFGGVDADDKDESNKRAKDQTTTADEKAKKRFAGSARRQEESGEGPPDAPGSFPRLGVSLQLLKRTLRDPRLQRPMCTLPFVSKVGGRCRHAPPFLA